MNLSQAAIVRDIGGLAGPGRNSAGPRHDIESLTVDAGGLHQRAIGQQVTECLQLVFVEIASAVDEVNKTTAEPVDRGSRGGQLLSKFLQSEFG